MNTQQWAEDVAELLKKHSNTDEEIQKYKDIHGVIVAASYHLRGWKPLDEPNTIKQLTESYVALLESLSKLDGK